MTLFTHFTVTYPLKYNLFLFGHHNNPLKTLKNYFGNLIFYFFLAISLKNVSTTFFVWIYICMYFIFIFLWCIKIQLWIEYLLFGFWNACCFFKHKYTLDNKLWTSVYSLSYLIICSVNPYTLNVGLLYFFLIPFIFALLEQKYILPFLIPPNKQREMVCFIISIIF